MTFSQTKGKVKFIWKRGFLWSHDLSCFLQSSITLCRVFFCLGNAATRLNLLAYNFSDIRSALAVQVNQKTLWHRRSDSCYKKVILSNRIIISSFPSTGKIVMVHYHLQRLSSKLRCNFLMTSRRCRLGDYSIKPSLRKGG